MLNLQLHCPVAKWRNWQTHQTQNLALFTERVGSTPTFATTSFSISVPFRATALRILYTLQK
jgi:hypothetical protein